mmetsp:Transcript_3746/g.6955  ORF Transcript_3746/g.6955 Transcript_3746/m.6955 type:complete len:216 (+) Transcript_3746:84-731(+)
MIVTISYSRNLFFALTAILSVALAYQPHPNSPRQRTQDSRRDFVRNVVALSVPASVSCLLPKFAHAEINVGGKPVYGDDKVIMGQKSHGTTENAVQENLRFEVDRAKADKISSYNRHFAEYGGYFTSRESYLDELRSAKGPITYYDSVSGKPLFVAPIGRSMSSFLAESEYHGWPSFRDEEVVWDNVRVLKGSGETVSTVGTHLGHNIPDKKGNR